MNTKTDKAMEWIAEADYIARVVARVESLANFNYDPACFLRYCDMQRNAADREGFANIAAEIAESARAFAAKH